MFEAAELGHELSPTKYKTELPKLRSRLLAAHLALRTREFSVIVIVSGADGAGKGELVQRLNEWLDPRGVATHAFWEPTDEERERPPYWRFWRAMPGRGRVGIFFGSWYSDPIIRRVYGKTKNTQLDGAMDHIVAFEKMLAQDGAVIVKLWLHLPKKEQKKRLKQLEKEGRIAPADWKHFKLFDKFLTVSERTIRQTDTPSAPWHVIEATDRRFRELTAGRILLEAMEKGSRATGKATDAAGDKPGKPERRDPVSILDHVNLGQKLTKPRYEEQLEEYQRRLSKLAWQAHAKERAMVLMFEGWDAAGKGSAIRRVTQAMDPRLYRVVGIAAPTEEERAQHYLWRFWRQLPRAGFTTMFDRSWYGRVLVERVEGFASVAEWNRAYGEINEFEELLTSHGIVVCKFWLHISRDEQLRRFKERQTVAYKRYKITDEDWRNREKWPGYQAAVDDMVAHCSTANAPWTLVAGNDKRFARIQILKTIVNRLESVL
ncbi:MAG: polyphosphate:AMP phosphotransferase [Opitutaceae bacterium]|nr:polyphosphate:AMP phosphotransferase [Opitutaceae bacterium]